MTTLSTDKHKKPVLSKFLTGVIFCIAPMGNILLPFAFLGSIRAFYFLLPISVAFLYLHTKIHSHVKFLLFLYFILCFTSIIININLLPQDIPLNKNPFFRLIIHCLIASFFILTSWIALNSSLKYKWLIIKKTLVGFIITLVAGFSVYVSVLVGVLPRQLYENMTVLDQEAYGYMRFSPGSYPNEFGVMSAYFCIVALYLIINKNPILSRQYLYLLFVLSFIGMALSTTRAAYLSFIISLGYMFFIFSTKYKIKIVSFIIVFFVFILLVIPDNIIITSVDILKSGYDSALNSTGSIDSRYIAWNEGWRLFKEYPFLGTGFENPQISMMHNTYLQFVFGLGLIGFICLSMIIAGLCFLFKKAAIKNQNKYDRQYRDLAIIGLINVLLFAMSNHNQNHFLTWFTVYLFFSSSYFSKKQILKSQCNL